MAAAAAAPAAAGGVDISLLGRRVRLTLRPVDAPPGASADAAPAQGAAAVVVEGDVFCVQADEPVPAGDAAAVAASGARARHGGHVVLRRQKHHTYQKADYSVVALAAVASVEDLGQARDPAPALRDFAPSEVARRYAAAAAREEQRLARRGGEGVTAEDQRVFDKMAVNFPDLRWEGRLIVVADRVAIQPPYLMANIVFANGVDDQEKRQLAPVLQRLHEVLTPLRAELGGPAL